LSVVIRCECIAESPREGVGGGEEKKEEEKEEEEDEQHGGGFIRTSRVREQEEGK